jgi:hypothetical protein
VEAEPNNDRARATRVPSLPAAVSGVIERDGDVDFYAFRAVGGQKLTFDLFARRIRMRLDSFLRVLDAGGKEIASNDDAVGKDSRLVLSSPVAGEYLLQVSDVTGQGGDSYGYRIEVTPSAAPDFKLTVTPDVVNLGQGGSEVLTVRAERQNDFASDIELRVEGLPSGITASTGAIRKGQETVQITLTAALESPMQAFPLRVVGTASIAGKSIEHTAAPLESYQPAGTQERRQRPVRFQVAGVVEPGPFTLTVEPGQVSLAPGATVTVTVKATRRPDVEAAKGEIRLEVQNVPQGVDVKAPAIAADKAESMIELKAPEKLDPQTVNLIVRGRLKESAPVAPAIPLVVVPKPPETPRD